MRRDRRAAPTPEPRPEVLIVDDISDIRLAYRLMLEIDGFKVTEAADGRDALDRTANAKVDVILADLYMPGSMDGIALIRAIRSRPGPHPRVIAMSGTPHLAYRSSLHAARVAGADAILTKPISRADLTRTIRTLIQDQSSSPSES